MASDPRLHAELLDLRTILVVQECIRVDELRLANELRMTNRSQARALRPRERAFAHELRARRVETCAICLGAACDVAMLCCGAPTHAACAARWAAAATTKVVPPPPSCAFCRAPSSDDAASRN